MKDVLAPIGRDIAVTTQLNLVATLGQVGFALGTDTAGSGRVPAGFNNLIGLKPTRGRLSTAGVVPACRSLDTVSVFAFTAADAETVLQVAGEYDCRDPFARPNQPTPLGRPALSADGFRFGVPGADQLEFFGDDEARGLVAEEMQQRGVELHLGTNVLEMSRDDASGGVRVKSTNGDERVFDKVMFATGRAPNTAGMGLEDIGVELGRNGEVMVDTYSQSTVPSIHAIGDVTDRVNLTPVAIRDGMAFVETIFGGNPTPVDHALIPTAIFTQPEIGTVGLSEEDASTQEPIEVYCTSFKPMQQAFAGRADRVLMKLIVSRENRKVLGCHIVAPGAGEMIQMAGIAVKMGATKEDFDRTVAVHPTMSEEIVTMKVPVRTG
jgi:Asp-tRNA(Asn)/Glu-tRNA(Gln) amidotransferase A subunit family amidase